LSTIQKIEKKQPALDRVDMDLLSGSLLNEETRKRLLGRYGADAPTLVRAATQSELEPVYGTRSLWAELRWAARAEGVVHLDDLLLRRVRLGLLTAQGGWPIMDRVRAIVQPELGWDDERWEKEIENYAELWHNCYSVPDALPDVSDKPSIELARVTRSSRREEHRLLHRAPELDGIKPTYRRNLAWLLFLVLVVGVLVRRRHRLASHP
jgi:hypothetical protein